MGKVSIDHAALRSIRGIGTFSCRQFANMGSELLAQCGAIAVFPHEFRKAHHSESPRTFSAAAEHSPRLFEEDFLSELEDPPFRTQSVSASLQSLASST